MERYQKTAQYVGDGGGQKGYHNGVRKIDTANAIHERDKKCSNRNPYDKLESQIKISFSQIMFFGSFLESLATLLCFEGLFVGTGGFKAKSILLALELGSHLLV